MWHPLLLVSAQVALQEQFNLAEDFARCTRLNPLDMYDVRLVLLSLANTYSRLAAHVVWGCFNILVVFNCINPYVKFAPLNICPTLALYTHIMNSRKKFSISNATSK